MPQAVGGTSPSPFEPLLLCNHAEATIPILWLHGLRRYSRNRLAVDDGEIRVHFRSGALRISEEREGEELRMSGGPKMGSIAPAILKGYLPPEDGLHSPQWFQRCAWEDAQKSSPSVKEERLISYTNPGLSTSQGNLVEPEIFVKEEPFVSDNEQKHYEMAYVDLSAMESSSHDDLSGRTYSSAHIPETYYGVETEPGIGPSDAQQSEHIIEKVVSLAAGSAHGSRRTSTQGSTRQDNVRCSEAKEQDKTSDPTEASSNHAKSRIRVMELTLEQLKKEHEANIREHEANMREHEANMRKHEANMREHEANMREHKMRMSNHKKLTELQVDIIKRKYEMKFTKIKFRYQDLKKKSDCDGKVQKLTIMNLIQKTSTYPLEHQEKRKLHELMVQELQQKLTNSQLEHKILMKKLKELVK
uniref:Uncharacterized protein n=1 Tax=Timema tahoe TaxID=61484 RepID=A0A7R9IKC0_9NEOP|nr:unnamed protein product [Timema tahoe]